MSVVVAGAYFTDNIRSAKSKFKGRIILKIVSNVYKFMKEETDHQTVNIPLSKARQRTDPATGVSERVVTQINGKVYCTKKPTTGAKKSGDYHNDVNGEIFVKWMKEKVLLNLVPNSLRIVDNAPYHKVQIDKAPTSKSMKQDGGVAYKKRNAIQRQYVCTWTVQTCAVI
ncbi:hypothetical protein J6590_056806 [Homalodisca vitripennis]|nr:hypothetical protein J6590_056806 [Homalodisca vitripennis]